MGLVRSTYLFSLTVGNMRIDRSFMWEGDDRRAP